MTIQPTISQLRMLATLRGQQWAIREDQVASFALAALESEGRIVAEGFDLADFYDLRQPVSIDPAGVAHIEVKGALMHKTLGIYEKLGFATQYSTIEAETRTAVAAGAAAIVYHVNSPGGTVAGVVEGGAAIANAGVPTVAHCDGLACSAAYWLASQAGKIVATPSAQVGNIGAILSWTDCTGMWEQMGVEFKALVSEGATLKSTFHLEPNAEQLAFLQDGIDKAGEDFRNAVTAGRTKAGATLDAEVWRAGWYSGEEASDLGLVDDIGSLAVALTYL